MGKITTIISGDATQLISEQKKVAAGNKAITDEYKKTATEAARLERIATQAMRSTRTDAERFREKMTDLGAAMKAGVLSAEDYSRAVKKLKEEYRDLDQPDVSTPWDQGIASLLRYATGLVSITALISEFKANLEAVSQKADEMAEKMQARKGTRGSLAQVATSKEDFQKLLSMSNQLMESGATSDRKDADRIVFALRSTGQESALGTFADVARTDLAGNIDQLINATDSLKKAFGEGETGDVRALLSKSLAVSAVSQKDMTDIAVNTARMGAIAAKVGISDEESLASVGVLANPLSSASTAADRMKALFVAAERQAVKGADLYDLLDNIEKKAAASGKTFIEFIGSSEAMEAYNLLRQNRDLVNQASTAAREANNGRMLDEKLGFLTGDAVQAATTARAAAEGTREVVEDETGIGQLRALRKSIIAQSESVKWLRGDSPASIERGKRWGTWFRDNWNVQTEQPQWMIDETRQAAREGGNRELLDAVNKLADLQRQAVQLQRELNEKSYRTRHPAVPATE